MLSEKQKKFLLNLARETIKAEIEKRKLSITCPDEPLFQRKTGGFVTLHKAGKLRGCIGYVIAYKTLFETIKEMAKAAAFNDPRFPSLQKSELENIEIEISVLSELIPVQSVDEIKIGRDGLLIQNNFTSGLLLPQVATEWKWDRKTFLEQTCNKAGLDRNCWQQSDTEIFRFYAEIFSESSKK